MNGYRTYFQGVLLLLCVSVVALVINAYTLYRVVTRQHAIIEEVFDNLAR